MLSYDNRKCVCVSFQVVEELDGPALEWDEEYVLSESPPLQELIPDQQVLQELCCDEEELQGLTQEEEEQTEATRDQEKILEVLGRTEEEGEATHDSGVETEELQRHSGVSQMTFPDDIIDNESEGENYIMNKLVDFL